MARYSYGLTKTTSTAAAAIGTLNMPSTRDARVWEVGISASTAVSGEVGVMRPANTPATPSGGGVGVAEDPSAGAALGTAANAWATAPTAGTAFRRMVLPATAGAGVIWTFPQGLIVPVSGWLVLWQFSALAVTYSFYIAWDE